MLPSSTSSFSLIPRAGLLAALLFVAIDAIGLGPCTPWAALRERIPGQHFLPVGVVRDQLVLRALAESDPTAPRVVVIGSSRVERGFLPNAIPEPEREALPLFPTNDDDTFTWYCPEIW